MEQEDYLVHYGVLGMKWGVRRASNSSSGGSTKSRKSNKAARLERKAERKKLKQERKQIFKDFEDAKKIKSVEIARKQARGNAVDKHYVTEAYKYVQKKHGAKKVDVAFKNRERNAEIATAIIGAASTAAVAAYIIATDKKKR